MFTPLITTLALRKGEKMMQSTVSFLTTLVLVYALMGTGSVSAAHDRHPLVGSWLVAYDVQVFGAVIPLMLSFGYDGVTIETDSPAPTPLGDLGILIVS